MNRIAKNIIIILWLISLNIIILGCSEEHQHVNRLYKDDNILNQTELFYKVAFSRDDNFFEVNYFPLSISNEGTLTDLTVFGNKIYYIVNFLKEQSTTAELSRVYEYDIITDEKKLIFEAKAPEVFWVNELRADEKKVYWTTLGTSKYTLVSFELQTQRVKEIHSVSCEPINQPMVLGGNSRYLSWNEYDLLTNSFKLSNYNLTEGDISFINEDIFHFHKFARPSINGDKALIIKDVNNNLSLNLINVKNYQVEQMFNLSKEIECMRPQVSNDYIVWNDFRGENIYFYNIKLNDVSKISFMELLNENIFSMHLYDNYLYIVSTGNEILLFDLREKNYCIITGLDVFPMFMDAAYSSSKISLDRQYISLLTDFSELYPKEYACIIKPKGK